MKRALLASASALSMLCLGASLAAAQGQNKPIGVTPMVPPGGTMSAPTIPVWPHSTPVPKSSESAEDTEAKKKKKRVGTAGGAKDRSGKAAGRGKQAPGGVGTQFDVNRPTLGAPTGSPDAEDSRAIGDRLQESSPRTQGPTGGGAPDTAKDTGQVQRPGVGSASAPGGTITTPPLDPRDQIAPRATLGGTAPETKTIPGSPMPAPTIAVQPRNVPIRPQFPEFSDDPDAKKKDPAPAASGASAGIEPASPGEQRRPAVGDDKLQIAAGLEELIKVFGGNPRAVEELRRMLEAFEKGEYGPLVAGALPGSMPGSDQPEIPVTTQPKGPRGEPTYIGRLPVPFTDKSGQAGSDVSWRYIGGSGDPTSREGARTYWSNAHGDSQVLVEHRSRDGRADTLQIHTRRADGTVEHETVVRMYGQVIGSFRTTDPPSDPPDNPDADSQPAPDDTGRGGGIVCFTELQCKDAIKKAQEARKKRPGPGGMPTESASRPTRTGAGTGPGAATDPNPEDLGVGGSGGGRSSGPPIYCVGEDCERPQGAGGGSTPPIPVPGASSP